MCLSEFKQINVWILSNVSLILCILFFRFFFNSLLLCLLSTICTSFVSNFPSNINIKLISSLYLVKIFAREKPIVVNIFLLVGCIKSKINIFYFESLLDLSWCFVEWWKSLNSLCLKFVFKGCEVNIRWRHNLCNVCSANSMDLIKTCKVMFYNNVCSDWNKVLFNIIHVFSFPFFIHAWGYIHKLIYVTPKYHILEMNWRLLKTLLCCGFWHHFSPVFSYRWVI